MPMVGKGYDSAASKIKPLSIFGDSLVTKERAIAHFDFSFSVFRNMVDFRDNFKFAAQLGVPIATSTNLNAALEFSGSIVLDKDVLIYVMHVLGVRKQVSAQINQDAFGADSQFQQAKELLAKFPNEFCGSFGDSFVKRVLLGGEIALVIKFKRTSSQRNKELAASLEQKLPGNVDLSFALNVLKDMIYNDLECDIYTQTKGFTSQQLPPADPQKFQDLAGWLQSFADKFHTIPDESFQTVVGYEVESYGVILPKETFALVEESEIRARYFFAIKRCESAIDYYIKYFQWMGDATQLEAFQVKKQTIENIKSMFNIKFDMDDPAIQAPIERLKAIIAELNAIKIPPRFVDEFSSVDFGRNEASGADAELRVSPSFQMPTFTDELTADHLQIEVIKDNNATPLKGNLSLLYSFNRKVPFKEGSFELARHINVGPRSTANLPTVLNENNNLGITHFAYHFALKKSSVTDGKRLYCFSPCMQAPMQEEQFRVRTYVAGKKQPPILSLDM